MNELFPVVCGTLAGLCASLCPVRWRAAAWIVLSVLCGVGATLVSGEFRFGWESLLVDVPLAAAAALAVIGVRRFPRPLAA